MPPRPAKQYARPVGALENFTIDEFSEWARVSRATTYRAIRNGLLKARRFGGRTVILRDDAKTFMKSLPSL